MARKTAGENRAGKNDVKQISREKKSAPSDAYGAKRMQRKKANARVDRSMRALENLEARQSDAK